MVFDEKKNHRIPEVFAVGIPIPCIQCYSSVKTHIHIPLYSMLFERKN